MSFALECTCMSHRDIIKSVVASRAYMLLYGFFRHILLYFFFQRNEILFLNLHLPKL